VEMWKNYRPVIPVEAESGGFGEGDGREEGQIGVSS